MQNVFRLFERGFAALQGKGSGSFTIKQEVENSLKLLNRSPNLVLDVGANKGEWTKYLLKKQPAAEVFLFEPQTACAENLRQKYKHHHNIKIIEAAASSQDATRSLYFDCEGSGMASLSKRCLPSAKVNLNQSAQVSTVKIDTFLSDNGLCAIDILKVDVEGHELEVFKGMENVLNSESPPKVIQFEFGGCNVDSRTFFRDFYDLFSENYEFYRQSPFGLLKIHQYRETDEHFVTTNFFLQYKRL